ncbi:MAG: general stress protein [Flavisolibacter sp.]|nr:general stress protein [Flavisolibacter sp.]MBD0288739.1 general stress protein [Flavisolibacter sp.]MBD0350081.1 general stress protein [Flavisolibacter sp.]MBD0374737.1 general stress protein [Flavisolibacter sp.]
MRNDIGNERTSSVQTSEISRTTSRRGFAAMDPERQRRIASEGGRAAHKQGVAHEWSSEEARAAGRKGGQNSRNGSRGNQS